MLTKAGDEGQAADRGSPCGGGAGPGAKRRARRWPPPSRSSSAAREADRARSRTDAGRAQARGRAAGRADDGDGHRQSADARRPPAAGRGNRHGSCGEPMKATRTSQTDGAPALPSVPRRRPLDDRRAVRQVGGGRRRIGAGVARSACCRTSSAWCGSIAIGTRAVVESATPLPGDAARRRDSRAWRAPTAPGWRHPSPRTRRSSAACGSRSAATSTTAACAARLAALEARLRSEVETSWPTWSRKSKRRSPAPRAAAAKQTVGIIREIGDGVAKVEGLGDVMLNEMLDFGQRHHRPGAESRRDRGRRHHPRRLHQARRRRRGPRDRQAAAGARRQGAARPRRQHARRAARRQGPDRERRRLSGREARARHHPAQVRSASRCRPASCRSTR